MEYSNETHHWQLRESEKEIKPSWSWRLEMKRGDGSRLSTGERINETMKQWGDTEGWKLEELRNMM